MATMEMNYNLKSLAKLFKVVHSTRIKQARSLLRRGFLYCFRKAGKWGEVKSKRAKPGEKGNESVRPRGDTGSFFIAPLPPPPCSTERDSAEERGNFPRARAKRESHPPYVPARSNPRGLDFTLVLFCVLLA